MDDIVRARVETGAILGVLALALVLAFIRPEGSLALSALLLGWNFSWADFRHMRRFLDEKPGDMLDRWFRQTTLDGTFTVLLLGAFLASLAGVLQGTFADRAPTLLFYASMSGVLLYILFVFALMLAAIAAGAVERIYAWRLEAVAARRSRKSATAS